MRRSPSSSPPFWAAARTPTSSTAIATRSDGNAYFVEELAGSGATRPDAVPETLREMLQTRVAGLPPDVDRLVRMCAAFGPEIDQRLVVAMAPMNAHDLAKLQRDAFARNVLVPVRDTSVPGATVNRLCGSGLEAASSAAARSRRRRYRVIAGGVESMSRAPWVLRSPDAPTRRATRRCTRPRWAGAWSIRGCPEWTVRWARAPRCSPTGRHRPRASRTSSRCQPPAGGRGLGRGRVRREIVPVPDVELDARRGDPGGHVPRDAVPAQAGVPPRAARSRPATPRRSTTARAALLLVDDEAAAPPGREPLARMPCERVDRRRAAAVRHRPGRGGATRRWSAPGIGWDEVEAVELNEAFAAQSLACLASGRSWTRTS